MLGSRSLDGAADVHRLKMGVIDIMNVQVTVITWINKLFTKGPPFFSYSMARLNFHRFRPNILVLHAIILNLWSRRIALA